MQNTINASDNGAPLLRQRNSRATQLLQDRDRERPVWIRARLLGPEHYTGFSRAKLYELAGARKIRSVSIREPGQVRGTRLFHLQSILDYIEKCEQAMTAEAAR